MLLHILIRHMLQQDIFFQEKSEKAGKIETRRETSDYDDFILHPPQMRGAVCGGWVIITEVKRYLDGQMSSIKEAGYNCNQNRFKLEDWKFEFTFSFLYLQIWQGVNV